MPRITALIASDKKPGRFDVQVDDKPFAVLSIDWIERLDLHTGDELDEAKKQAIEDAAAALRTLDRALAMLASRGRAAAGLERRLVEKGESKEHARWAVERLKASGWLDDGAFARSYARSRALSSGHAPRRLQADLVRQGVSSDEARRAVGEVLSDGSVDLDETLDGLVRKKLRSLASLDRPTRERRLFGFLARRGYSLSDIRKSLDRVSREE